MLQPPRRATGVAGRLRPGAPPTDADRRTLLASTLDDAVAGLFPGRRGRALRLCLLPFARRFAREVEEADAVASRRGLAAAGRLLLDAYAGPLAIDGDAAVPSRGPLLIVSNHPGTVDAPALMAALARRPDLRIIALDRPFLRAIPGLARHLLYVGDADRQGLLRRGADHLRAGGAILTFPAGTIEPDPALRPEAALASLASWSRSPAVLTRLVPATVIVPVAVSGVLSTRALRSPVVQRLSAADRELGAATWQLIRRDRSIRPRLRFGDPLPRHPDAAALDSAMRALLTAQPGD